MVINIFCRFDSNFLIQFEMCQVGYILMHTKKSQRSSHDNDKNINSKCLRFYKSWVTNHVSEAPVIQVKKNEYVERC